MITDSFLLVEKDIGTIDYKAYVQVKIKFPFK